MDNTIKEIRAVRKAVDKEFDGRFSMYVKALIAKQNKTADLPRKRQSKTFSAVGV